MNQEQLFDRNTDVERSDINLESTNLSGNLGIEGWVLGDIYADFVFVEYIDIDKGFQTTKSGLIVVQNTNKSWRRGIVRSVSPFVARNGHTKVGDIVLFPSDKGLQTGKFAYKAQDGSVQEVQNAVFLNEARIFAKIEEAPQTK